MVVFPFLLWNPPTSLELSEVCGRKIFGMLKSSTFQRSYNHKPLVVAGMGLHDGGPKHKSKKPGDAEANDTKWA